MSTSAPPLLFAHAMWRSGSTYLASRFDVSERYLMFYEPCHEGIARKPGKSRDRDRSRDRGLRHPGIEGGYFGNYETTEPTSGRALADLFAPEISLRHVYNGATDGVMAYLSALGRTASARGQTAYLGFCRSGSQTADAARRLGGQSLHLWREAREQFASYDWPRNDYFLPGTVMQLAFSRRYAQVLERLAPSIGRSPELLLARLLPDSQARNRYRLARRVAARLSMAEAYAVFYLSWRISHAAARAVSDISVSLTELAGDATLRERFESMFGITLLDLRPTPNGWMEGIDYAAVEAVVLRVLEESGLSVMEPT